MFHSEVMAYPLFANKHIFYFDAYDSGVEEWQINPSYMIDPDTTKRAYSAIDGDVQLLTGNTVGESENLGTITKVELRSYGYYTIAGTTKNDVFLRPVFTGGDGDNHTFDLSGSPTYSSYFDITNDTNAPTTWTWTDVRNLDCDVELDVDGSGNGLIGIVEIRVTANHNVTWVSSTEPLVELGRGYQNAGSVSSTTLNVSFYAPADWTVNSFSCRPLLPFFMECDAGWTDDWVTFPSTVWIYNDSIRDNDSIENFLQQAGVWDDIDIVFRSVDYANWQKGAGGNTLHNITDGYMYWFKFFNATYMEIAYGNGPGDKLTGGSYSQVNASYRQYSVVYNPPNNIGVNQSWIGLNVSVAASNATESYDEYNTFYQVFELFECKSPTNVRNVYNTTWESVNMTWYPGNNTDSTVVVRSNHSYPTDPMNGWQVFNSTGRWFNDTTVNDTRYYTVFGYNATFNCYSAGVDNPWGVVGINVFNESNPSQAIGFDIEITDSAASQVYFATDCTNTHFIDFNDIPYGDDTIFVVSNSSYRDRVYYYDLNPNQVYNYSFYLPPIETPGDPSSPEDENISRLYRLRVVDENLYPVDEARVDIQRRISDTEYSGVSVVITNGYGESDVWLIPNVHYKVFISKTGYTSAIDEWFPDPVFYGADYPTIFTIYSSTSAGDIFTFWDFCILNSTRFDNSSIRVMFEDTNRSTTNLRFTIIEVFNFTETLFAQSNVFTVNNMSLWITATNLSRSYRVVIRLNHTYLGWVNQTILIGPYRTAIYDSDEFENKIENVIGEFDLGYVRMFFVFVPFIVVLVAFGRSHPGFGVVGGGLWLGFSGVFLEMPVQFLIVVPFVVAVGVILMVVKGGESKL